MYLGVRVSVYQPATRSRDRDLAIEVDHGLSRCRRIGTLRRFGSGRSDSRTQQTRPVAAAVDHADVRYEFPAFRIGGGGDDAAPPCRAWPAPWCAPAISLPGSAPLKRPDFLQIKRRSFPAWLLLNHEVADGRRQVVEGLIAPTRLMKVGRACPQRRRGRD